ncbi:MAG: hypothetical protein M9939_26255 [Mesorhizobium sp.]|nr:hypothetical protein [Mesorhizobium sp.]MCO5164595.1 hypothetical protein [Mesorhizobium sp.]
MRMILPVLALAAAIIFGPVGSTREAKAASEAECAIWICLPGGFPGGCEAAHSAMIARIKSLRPPLPPFKECSVEAASNSMTFNWGMAAYLPERRVCTRSYQSAHSQPCAEWTTMPETYVKGTSCLSTSDGERQPAGCVATYRYGDVFSDGVPIGDTYYWR